MQACSLRGKGLRVVAFRSNYTLEKESFMEYTGVYAIDATNVYGIEHIEFAIEKSKKAFETGENLSNDIFIEIILRASGQRQITRALKLFGLNGSKEIVIFGDVSGDLKGFLDGEEFEIEITGERCEVLKQVFSISDKEIATVSDHPHRAIKQLIKERIALTSIL